MAKITWVKPNKSELVTNDSPETVAYLESIGFKRKAEKRAAPKKTKVVDSE